MDFRTPAVATRRTRPRNVARSFSATASAARPVQSFTAVSFADSVSSARQALRAESYGEAVSQARRRILAPSYADGISSATPGTGLPVYTTGYAKRRLVVAPAVAGAGTLTSFPLPVTLDADLVTTNGVRAVANDGTLLATDLAAARAVYALVPSWNRTLRGRWYVHHDRPTAAETATAATVWAGHAALLRCGAAPADLTGLRTPSAAGGPTATSIGVWPAGLFDGVDDINKLPSVAAWNGSAAFTLACLVQANAANPTGGIWVTGTAPDAAGGRAGLRVQAGKLVARVETSAGLVSVQTSAVAIGDTQPHHLAVTWTAGERPAIWVDGVKVATTDLNVTGLAGTTLAVLGDLWVGVGADPATNGRFAGKIGEVAVSLSARAAGWLGAAAQAYVSPVSLLGSGADDAASEASSAASAVAVPVILQASASATVNASLSAAIENAAGGAITYALVGSPSAGSATLAVAQLTVTTPAGYTRLTGQYRVTTVGGKQSTGTYIVALPTGGFWTVVDPPATTYRRFYAGPMNFNNNAKLYWGNVAPFQLLSADVIGVSSATDGGGIQDPNADWTYVAGGPIVAHGKDAIVAAVTSLSNAKKQAKWSAAELGKALDSLIAAYPAAKNKHFIIPIMYSHPSPSNSTYTEVVSGDRRPKLSLFEEIARGDRDDEFIHLGCRTRLNMVAYGYDLNKLIIRWDKEGNRVCNYGMPHNFGDSGVRTTWRNAFTRLIDCFKQGYGEGSRHFYGLARNPARTGYYPLADIFNADGGPWDAVEVSMHPGIEMDAGILSSDNEATIRTKVRANFTSWVNGDLNGYDFREVIQLCKDQKKPLIISESDPSHGAGGNVCWVPEYTGEIFFEQFNSWHDDLAASGLCLMQGMYDDSNLSQQSGLGFWGSKTSSQSMEEYIRTENFNVPSFYPSYTSAVPIPTTNWANIKTAYLKRYNGYTSGGTRVKGWYDIFYEKWGG